MTEPHFVPSTLHVTANAIDIAKDLDAEQTKSIGELLEEEKEKSSIIQCGRTDISEHS